MAIRVEHTVQVWKEGDTYVARAVPLDVLSCGDTPEEARANLREAVGLFLKTAAEHGTLVAVLEESGCTLQGDEWRAPELVLTETVTQSVEA
jgi:predicted RNase H-like HicB family nuclease